MKRLAFAVAVVFVASCGICADVKPFRYVSWNIGHYAYGRGKDTKVSEENAESRAAEYRKFLDRMGAKVLGICEYSENFTSNGAYKASQAVFGRYREQHVGPCESWQWNCIFHNGFRVMEKRVKYYPKHKQNTYYAAVKVDLGDGRPAWFVQTHLDWGNYFPGHEDDRADQIRILIADFKDEPRVVISGDFNTLKWHPPAKPGANPWETSNFEEFQAFVKAGYALANSDGRNTAPTHKPNLAIDNVIVRGFRMSEVEYYNCGNLSDHMAVGCTLSVE